QKKKEVVVRGKWVLYSEANINIYFGLTVEEDDCQATLESLDEASLTEIMNEFEEGTQWNYRKGVNEWSIKRMSLKPVMRVWYQFLKHTIMPTTHNETVNKARLVLLQCITAGQNVNVGRIISQEIVNCSAKKSKK
ncbi:hypothetical protein A2U01_0056725, partial [Trifolium medium]|nr:hypothetical protein [Trifolium medium]